MKIYLLATIAVVFSLSCGRVEYRKQPYKEPKTEKTKPSKHVDVEVDLEAARRKTREAEEALKKAKADAEKAIKDAKEEIASSIKKTADEIVSSEKKRKNIMIDTIFIWLDIIEKSPAKAKAVYDKNRATLSSTSDVLRSYFEDKIRPERKLIEGLQTAEIDRLYADFQKISIETIQ